jgi:hypothetical protein
MTESEPEPEVEVEVDTLPSGSGSGSGGRAGDYTVLPTTTLLHNHKFEVSLFKAPKMLFRELDHVFSSITRQDMGRLLAVLTCQHSDTDLVKYGDEADVEKDKCLEEFVKFAKVYCDAIIEEGYWADYIE